jgi:hypothetical protein
MVRVAVPEVRMPVPIELPPSRKVMTSPLAPPAVIVAVNVTGVPNVEGVPEVPSPTDEGSFPTVALRIFEVLPRNDAFPAYVH